MEQLIQQVASGLANGAIYACLALALVMIFVSTDHINFAQGELAMFSAYLVWQALRMGRELLGRAASGGAALVPDRRRHRARDPAAAAPRAGPVGGGGVHRPAGDLPFAGGRHLGPHHQGASPRRSRKSPSPAPATSARIRSA